MMYFRCDAGHSGFSLIVGSNIHFWLRLVPTGAATPPFDACETSLTRFRNEISEGNMGILYYGEKLTPTTYGIYSITGPSGTPQPVMSGIDTVFNSFNALAIGNTFYFEGNDGTDGWQLWETNGTTTTMLTNNSGGAYPFYLTNVNGTLFFRINNPTIGYGL